MDSSSAAWSHVLMDDIQQQSIKSAFGARVRYLREVRGMSQEALALLCELDRSYIGGVERGERNISLVNIYKIAHSLGVHVKELME